MDRHNSFSVFSDPAWMTSTGYSIVAAGGNIDDDFAVDYIRSHSCGKKPFLIAADRGLDFLNRHDFVPDLLVGDFDSIPGGFDSIQEYLDKHRGCEMRSYSWEKDYTDTEIAAAAACERGCCLIDMLGCTGTRIDHVLGSIQDLSLIMKKGCTGRIIDPYNRITLHDSPFTVRRDGQWGKYVSFFAFGGPVEGLTLEGFHFPAKDIRLDNTGTLAVSNQISEDEAKVSFGSGQILMIESRD